MLRARERIGVFGGTFDPIHAGHVAAATGVRRALDLDRVLLVVANVPWQKIGWSVTPAEERFAMVMEVAGELEGIEASRVEIDRGGLSYTVDTLAQLQLQYPDAALFLVVGADVAGEIETWERVEEIRPLARLVVADRPGARDADLMDRLGRAGWSAQRVEVPLIDMSSTDIRRRFAAGSDVDDLVPPSAIRFIRSRGLYAGGR